MRGGCGPWRVCAGSPSGGSFSELRSERAQPGQLRSAQKTGSATFTDLDRAASSYPSSPSSSTDEGSKSLMTVDTSSAVLATIFVCQLLGAAICLRGPQRTVANSSELHQNLCETLESRRTPAKLGECRQNLAEMRVAERLSTNLRDPHRTFENLG